MKYKVQGYSYFGWTKCSAGSKQGLDENTRPIFFEKGYRYI